MSEFILEWYLVMLVNLVLLLSRALTSPTETSRETPHLGHLARADGSDSHPADVRPSRTGLDLGSYQAWQLGDDALAVRVGVDVHFHVSSLPPLPPQLHLLPKLTSRSRSAVGTWSL